MTKTDLNNALLLRNKTEWRKWLEKNHSTLDEIWLIHYKKSSNKKNLNHYEAVEEALCFGWIDSTLKRIDDEKYILRYTPRKNKSVWSKINKETAKRMISDGKMTTSGIEKINTAKKNGLWKTAYTNKIRDKLPSDLEKSLSSDRVAWENFQNFANSYSNMYIGWVNNAKTEKTRIKRINEVVKRSRKNQKPGE